MRRPSYDHTTSEFIGVFLTSFLVILGLLLLAGQIIAILTQP